VGQGAIVRDSNLEFQSCDSSSYRVLYQTDLTLSLPVRDTVMPISLHNFLASHWTTAHY